MAVAVHPEANIDPRFYAGLDIGQMSDPSALAILERELLDDGTRLEARFLLRYLERIPLMTSYPAMVDGVTSVLLTLNEPCHLICDATGVGRPVVDMFRVPVMRLSFEDRDGTHHKLMPIAVTITNGEHVASERFDEWHVPKRLLIMGLQVALQQGRLRVSSGLAEGPLLVKELQQFKWRPDQAAGFAYESWGAGLHGDMIYAVALALWYGSRFLPRGGGRRQAAPPPAQTVREPLWRRQRLTSSPTRR